MKLRTLLGLFGPLILVVGCAQSDAGITTAVKTQLVADDLVKARQINVDTKNHVVTLTGMVQSPQEETQALQIARDTKGVSNVVDNITVQGEQNAAPTSGTEPAPMNPGTPAEATTPPQSGDVPAVPPEGRYGDRPLGNTPGTDMSAASSSAPSSTSDSDLSAQVKAALIGDRSFNGQAITVDVKDGVATLTGTVNSAAEKTKAGDDAGKVAKVSRVDNQLMIKK